MSDAEARTLTFLLPLSEDYPGIARWFVQKVVPGVRQGTRLLLPVERDGAMVGLGIAKKEADECKICTVRVAPTYAGRGIGVRLFDGLLKWLDHDRPHLTVSATKLPQFERIFDYYGFDVTSAHEGLYVPKMTELGYNDPVILPISTSLPLVGTDMSRRGAHQA
ncbi:N-acetyltransferase [Sphingobium lactosutens]|nr:GNAT family N-acetyltransferase [Sphingobium lactosutens]NWK99180.1 N-acetyltransferase [Sphingobium lactosutens]